MRARRAVLLATAALAVIACAAPATAPAAGTWTLNYEKFQEDATLQLTGGVQFVVASLGSYSCQAKVEVTLTESWGKALNVKTGKGHVVKFELVTDTCVGTGLLQGCALSKHVNTETEEGSWPLTATKTDISMPLTVVTHYEFSGCATSETEVTVESLTLEPDEPLTMNSLEINSKATVHAFGVPLSAGIVGTLEFAAGDAGKYGVHQRTPQQEEEEETEEE